MRQHLLLASALAATITTARAEAPFAFDQVPGKLPKTIVPDAYRIAITPNLITLKLAGHESIDLHVRASSPTIVLNQAGLKLKTASLEDGTQASIALDQKAETATLTFTKPIPVGRHTLDITYTGPIPNTPSGIYYDDYKTPAGATKRMLVSQFEVSDARRMFPGWDEPAFKATFQLSVTLPPDLAVVSNMPETGNHHEHRGLKTTEFAPTPRMSTYLLALLAGDMQAVSGMADGTNMSVWAPSGEQDQGNYALHAEREILPYYNSYFGVKYPLPKLDLIAVPGNYAAGAMENWGAITFVDDVLLFDPKTSAPSTREEIYEDTAHEMAHQWSGDLVTMGWWDNIWLNEGFATWMEVKATDHFNPSWEIWPRQHSSREQAMRLDAMPTTHPIQQTIHDESEADSAFDVISYQKGSQIIRMVEDWIGPDRFRAGMQTYMNAHKFGNATSADLWAALTEASHQDVAKVAASFTEQPGIPLVHVASSCIGGKRQVTLSQTRFTIHDPHPAALTWSIPVTIGGPNLAPQRAMLTAQPAILEFGDCTFPLKANFGEDGYYRTQYDPASLQAIQRAMPSFAPADRANLLGDQFALFVAANAPLTDYLNLLTADHDEQDIAVWTDTLSHMLRLNAALLGSPLQDRFHRWAADLIRPEAQRLGWDAKPGESFLDALLRPQLIDALGRLRDPATIAETQRRFAAFLQNPAALPPSLRDPVLTIVGETADEKTWDTLRQRGIQATGTEEKLRYFFAMSFASDPKLIEKNVAFTEAGAIPNGRILAFLTAMSEHCGNPQLVYQTVKPREKQITTHLPPDSFSETPLIAAALGSTDPAIARDLLAQPSSNATSGIKIDAAHAADSIEAAHALLSQVETQLAAWLHA